MPQEPVAPPTTPATSAQAEAIMSEVRELRRVQEEQRRLQTEIAEQLRARRRPGRTARVKTAW